MTEHSAEEARLIAALDRRASEIDVRPDINAVFDATIEPQNINPESSNTGDEKSHPLRSARVLAAAAAMLILGGLVWTVASSESGPVQLYAQQPEQACQPFDGRIDVAHYTPGPMVVEWLPAEACPIELRDRMWRGGAGGSQSHTVSGDLLTVDVSVAFGFEGESIEYSLTLRDTGALPEFVSLVQVHTPYIGSPNPGRQVAEPTPDRIVIDAWDRAEERFSGHVVIGPNSTGVPVEAPITFFIDEGDDSDLARWLPHGGVNTLSEIRDDSDPPVSELRAALTSNDRDRELDALYWLDARTSFQSMAFQEEEQVLTQVVPELIGLLDGGAAGEVATEYQSAVLLARATQPSEWQRFEPDLNHRRSPDFFIQQRFIDPVSAFMPFDPTDQGQVDQATANWQQIRAVGTDSPPRVTFFGETLPQVTDQGRELAGSYWEQPSCMQEEWSEPCGTSLTLFCNGNAMWNEGNEIVTAAWALLDGELVFSTASAELAEIVKIENGRIDGMTRATTYACDL